MDFLCFKTDRGQDYAVDIRDLIAIKEVDNITTVPGCIPACVGMFMYLGELIPVVDVSLMYHGVPEDSSTVIILEGNEGKKYGMLVDSVGSIVRGEVPENINFLDAHDFERIVMNSTNVNEGNHVELF